MKKLLRTIHGSHLYGTNIEGSDHDYKEVILPSREHLLLGKPLRNVVSQTNTSGKNTVEDVDIERIYLHTFVRDFVKGQTYALELAFCPAVQITYSKAHNNVRFIVEQPKDADYRFALFVEALREECLTRNISAMLGYCLGQARKYSLKGERLNEVAKVRKIFQDACENGLGGKRVKSLAKKCIGGKYTRIINDETHTHLQVCEKKIPFTVKVSEAHFRLIQMEESFGERAISASLEGADWKALMHACRVGLEAKQLLTRHKLVLPFTGQDKQFLLDVRNGKIPFDDVIAFLDELVTEVKDLEVNSTLPSYEDVKEKSEKMLLEFLEESLD